MLAGNGEHAPFSHSDWIFEIKYDGYRMLAEFVAGQVRLRTRQGQNCTSLVSRDHSRALSTFEGGPFRVNGGVCVLDDLGRSAFNRLQARARRKCRYPWRDPVTYCILTFCMRGVRC
ncbi:ATP-dependent DNA ligase [Ramlibacter sp. Leaf400]|uniref:ATP-dependent DNA ligase n=1 Tax=Ramlibacter sp. Leaf400 TaxID=1736365 RepID=UPI000701A48A|nr:hypothetical protein [Ramlibacter sp. Leaf400]KQT10329.1 hypothetical protein ASG30_10815 [Ramlibacter sp. Leaf400]